MDAYIGEIRMFAGDFAPSGWSLCNGSLLSINQWSALYSLIQNYYGGDGVQTFAVPDLRGRAPVSAGQGPGLSNYYLGQRAGGESVTITTAQMPAHNHLVNANSVGANQILPTGFYPSDLIDPISGDGTNLYSNVAPDVTLNAGTISTTGGSQPVKIVPPVLAVNYIIALVGEYPSRS